MTLVYSSDDSDEIQRQAENLRLLLDRRRGDNKDDHIRLEQLEEAVKELIKTQDAILKQLELVATVLTAAKGAFQVLEFLGKVAKPLIAVAIALGGIAALVTNHKVG